ncbi:hypothetical protein Sango_2477400 [Sesamum angolense]|uniref:ATP-dependent DNA helicase n=1 Tax=Sesamum angolense TaxID=2727404 RepID=A0AAE1W3M3_9LAMI|nr:hypothetical protein Sango_2477400 [Sesamum angolense]
MIPCNIHYYFHMEHMAGITTTNHYESVHGRRITCCDYYAHMLQIEAQKLRWIRFHQIDIRAELYEGLQDCLTAGENNAGNVGRRIILPSSFTGSPRDMYQRYQDAMAIVQKFECTVQENDSYPIYQRCNDHRSVALDNEGEVVVDNGWSSSKYICTRIFQNIILASLRKKMAKEEHNPKGPKSFDDLLTVDGVHYLTFKQAAEKHGLLEDDNSIRECLVEARSFRMPSALRRLFATILLYQHKRSIKEFDLPQISEGFEDMRAISGVIEHELSIPISDDDLYGSRVLNAGGIGKTFLYRTLLASFRNDGCIILATATSGIAANLLPGGRTTHSKFKIPIKFEPMAMCRFRGDFRQVLPVVIIGTKSQIIKASIIESSLWYSVKVLNLSKNMRAQHDPHFSDFLLRVGNGDELTIENDMIRIPDSMAMHWEGENSIDELINAIFPDLSYHMYDTDYMETRAIITPLNDDVNKLNEKAINAFPGEEVTYYSFDSVPDDTRNLYLPEFLNSISPRNLLPHKLVLKKGQTIPNVGIYLPNHVFSHGQLYVALSRGVSKRTTKVLVKKGTNDDHFGIYTKNVANAFWVK